MREPPKVDGRVPPHDLDAEAAVLSAIMIDSGDEQRPSAMHLVIDMLRSEHFYSEAHHRIFEACIALAEEGKPVDLVQVGTWLKNRERIQQIGGMGYLTEVLNAAPAVANVRAYAQTVIDKYKARQVILAGQRVAAQGYLDYGDANAFASDAAATFHAIAMQGVATTTSFILDTIKTRLRAIAEAAKSGQRITGRATGFDRFDRMTSGLHDGDLTVIAARPGMGKTSLALDIARNVASGDGARRALGPGVIVFSLEMPKEQLVDRFMSADGRVDLGKIRNNMMTAEDWNRLTNAAKHMGGLPIWINDKSGLSVLEMMALVRRADAECQSRPILDADGNEVRDVSGNKVRRRIGLAVIDYLQLMRGHGDSREQEVASISRGLKAAAKELKIPVVALAQLNRGVETRGEKNKRPQLSDLRESGAIEQDADNIVFIYRDDYYNRESEEKNIAELIIAKQRNGPTGTAKVRFDREYTRFDNLAEGEHEDEGDDG